MISNCVVCKASINIEDKQNRVDINGNTACYHQKSFRLWFCPRCQSLTALDPVEFKQIYSAYPLQKRKLDYFAHKALSNLAQRLVKVGMTKESRILDWGCGNGVFIQYLQKQGYRHIEGFDPFEASYQRRPQGRFDFIIANDVIEHLSSPDQLMIDLQPFINPQGIVYIGTTCTDFIDHTKLSASRMLLHQPYHRFIFSKKQFKDFLIRIPNAKMLAWYERSYMDTFWPFVNYRFLDSLNHEFDHVIDKAFDPIKPNWFMVRPWLFWWGLVGYWFRITDEPAGIIQIEQVSLQASDLKITVD